jgi:hypothetical protein
MPPKVAEEPKKVVVEYDGFDGRKKFEQLERQRDAYKQRVLEKCQVVAVRPCPSPVDVLRRRMETYKNVRRARTDYKNYTRRYGKPPFNVPSEIEANIFH